jgi:hypothetical protein
MNNPLDRTLRELNDCGCCAGTAVETPVAIDNRPGLKAISFRAGKQPQFKATMKASLSAADSSALQNLKTREDDDFTIALLDGWAMIADVLTFYSERIANESYLRTAIERESVLELARSIGYELNPGVAASTYLVFTVDDSVGAPGYAKIDAGTKVQSIPYPDETAQVFETLQDLDADKTWNSMAVKSSDFVTPYLGMNKIYLEGTTTNLNPGDPLLIIGDERIKKPDSDNWDFRRVKELETFPDADAAKAYTVVTLDRGLGSFIPHVDPAQKNPKVYALRQRAALFGANAAEWKLLPLEVREKFGDKADNFEDWPGFTVAAVSEPEVVNGDQTSGLYGEYFDDRTLTKRKLVRIDSMINFNWFAGSPNKDIGFDTFSIRWTGWIKPTATGQYGFRAHVDNGVRLWIDEELVLDDWNDKPPRDVVSAKKIRLRAGKRYSIKLEFFENVGDAQIQLFWTPPGAAEQLVPSSVLIPIDIATIHLDAIYAGVVTESWIVLSSPTYQEVYRVKAVAEDSPAKFALSTKSTKLTLTGENLREKFNDQIRETVVFEQSEELPWAKAPFYDAVFGDEITLDETVLDLPADRVLLVSGLPARVEVTEEGAALELILADGTAVPLIIGDTLSLTGPPAAQSGTSGISRWELKMEDGTEGFLFASAEQLKYVAAEESSERIFERATLKRTETTSDGLTRLVLAEPLTYAYDPATTLVYANVAFVTEGETTKDEILGSGDATQANQSFTLSKTPLTYIPAATVSGGESTLKITVNDVEWTEVSSLYGRGQQERIYVTRLADDGKVTVMFGDGESGTRPPTGQENVKATYRTGTGVDGILKAEQLSLLMTRPLGVKSVINPEATTGAVDPQELEDARENAPTTVLTLDRVVSQLDYEDFARNFSGIVKALATWTWNEHSRGMYLTVAGEEGTDLTDSSTITALRDSLLEFGNPLVPIQIESYKKVSFKLSGTIYADADRDPDDVGTAVNDALKAAFSFDARAFGQPVTLSEVEAVIQNVTGVSYIDLDALYIGTASALETYLAAQAPHNGTAFDSVTPAELLTLDESSLSGLEVTTV